LKYIIIFFLSAVEGKSYKGKYIVIFGELSF